MACHPLPLDTDWHTTIPTTKEKTQLKSDTDSTLLSTICCKTEAEDLRFTLVSLIFIKTVCVQMTNKHPLPPDQGYLIKFLLKKPFDFLFLCLAVGE